MPSPTPVPAIEGWFTSDAHRPALVGQRCPACGTYVFPPTARRCPNPACGGEDMGPVELSRQGRIWSYTDCRYQPPPPYVVPGDEHEPFCLAAVELEAEGLVVLGQVVPGFTVDDLHVGQPVELVVETLFVAHEVADREGPVAWQVWKWRPMTEPATAGEEGPS